MSERRSNGRDRRSGERRARFSTISDVEIRPLYGPEDLADLDEARDLGRPGEYPFTRGIHPTM
ncbi:MAG: methylmalonyl-CoA mutase, partial [Armatimonadetes bacterium]|nr:methylmalonyl-CoA mutase [Armatimonadota bacterium]